MFNLFRQDEILFDIVDKNGNNVKATFDAVERIVQLVAFDNVASTLLLVWTGLNGPASACLSVSLCPVGILSVTHQAAACDMASVHFGPTINRTDMLVVLRQAGNSLIVRYYLHSSASLT